MLPDTMYDYRVDLQMPVVVDTCTMCEREIYEGETYYSFPEVVCEDCVQDYVEPFKKQ